MLDNSKKKKFFWNFKIFFSNHLDPHTNIRTLSYIVVHKIFYVYMYTFIFILTESEPSNFFLYPTNNNLNNYRYSFLPSYLFLLFITFSNNFSKRELTLNLGKKTWI